MAAKTIAELVAEYESVQRKRIAAFYDKLAAKN